MTQENTIAESTVTEAVNTAPVKKTKKAKTATPAPASTVKKTPVKEGGVDFDMAKLYQDYFEAQQKQVLQNWTSVMNSMFWWTKK